MSGHAMKYGMTVLLVFSALMAAADEAVSVKMDDLGWLAGCWRQTAAEPGSIEMWTAPAAGTMFGLSRTVRKGAVREFEFLRIHEQDGAILYTAKPSGQAETSFKLISSRPDALVFENPQHDFPQRILYTLKPDGSVLARIEGQINGKPRARDFPLLRGACDVR